MIKRRANLNRKIQFCIPSTNFYSTKKSKKKVREKLTGSPNKGEQEVESKESEFWGRLGFGEEVQETQIGKQRSSK